MCDTKPVTTVRQGRRKQTRPSAISASKTKAAPMIPKLGFIFAICLSPLILIAQDSPAQQKDGDFTIAVDVELVQLPVSVVDKDGRLVDGLTQEHFQVFENNQLQKIGLFKHEDIPLSVGLVID